MLQTLADVLAGIGYVADTPGALARGVLAGRPGERLGGREMLESWGAVGPNRDGLDAGDAWGLGADMLFDPLNLIGAGWLTKLMAGNKAIRKSNAASAALRAAGAMPEEVAKLTKIKGVPEYEELRANYGNGKTAIEKLFRVRQSDQPMRMYHGTSRAFDKYDMSRMSDESLYGKGIYTTSDPHVASEYTNVSAPDPLVTTPLPGIEDAYRKIMARRLGGYPDYIKSNTMSRIADDDVARKEAVDLLDSSRYINDPEYTSDYASLLKHAKQTGGSGQNVRMQYIDARNPFDADAPLDDAAGQIRKRAEEIYANGPAVKYIPHPVTVSALNDVRKQAADELRDIGPSLIGRHAHEWFEKYSPLGANKELAGFGYDAITHKGGSIVGSKPHFVTVAFDPSQIYSPYIAPALRDQHRTGTLLSALLGYNVAAHNPMHDL